MKTFDPNIILELEKEGQRFFFLIELQLNSATYYYNNSDIDIYKDGNKYNSLDFTFGTIDQSSDMGVDTVSMIFNSADGVITATILSEDILSRTAILSFICVDDDYQIIAAEYLFRGFISNWKIEDAKSTMEIKNEMILWRKETLRACSSSCPWEFKGIECAYAGDIEWCNQSYEHCSDLANTDNFGGHRFLPDIMEKEIWWGRTST